MVFDAPHKFRVLSVSNTKGDETSFASPLEVGTPIRKRKTQYVTSDIPSFEDCFSEYTASCRRFRDQLNSPANFAALTRSPQGSIKNIILKFILDDHLEIMSDFREALDFIDEHLSDDNVLRKRVQQWRYLLGQWKSHLSSDITYISYITRVITHETSLNNDPTTESTGTKRSVKSLPIRADLDNLIKEMNSLTTRAKSTFQDIMATMSIVESQKAIAQAETISKLTNLAFFFIPLTLTASIFGMNFTVNSNTHSRLWRWHQKLTLRVGVAG